MYFFMQPWVIYVQEENPTENIFSILRSFHNLHQFGCRTTKLLSQKRRHLAVFSISFLWQKGTRPEKRKDYYLNKKPSRGILHRSNLNRLLWILPNWNLALCTEVRFSSFFSGGFITAIVGKTTGKETGKTHVCALATLIHTLTYLIDEYIN